MDPCLGVCVEAVAVQSPGYAVAELPLNAVGVLVEFFGELDPHGIFDSEGSLEFIVGGPYVASDCV